MKALLALALIAAPVAGQVKVERPIAPANTGPIVVALDGIPTSALVTMLLRDVMRVPYVIAPEVLSDRRLTSVKLVIPRNDIPNRVVTYLRKAGFTVQLIGGTVHVSKGGRGGYEPQSYGFAGALASGYDLPTGSPLEPQPRIVVGAEGVEGQERFSSRYGPDGGGLKNGPEPQLAPPAEILAYIPAHREPAYLSSVITAILPGIVFGARADVKAEPSEQAIRPDNGPDTLVMAGSQDDLRRARQLIQLLDRPRPMVAVKAVVMQVNNVQSRGSALSILARLGDGRLTVGVNPADPPASNFVRIAAGATSAVLSAVREDSRFKVVATPNLAALSGEVATMNAGASVPTVGAVTIAEGGTPVQSVVYRDSGITLSVRPVVRGELVQLQVKQERSTFTPTTTGVENSPTLNKSAAEASVTLKSGESVVLAGLTEASAGNRREGLLGGLLGVRSRDKSDSELLVVLTAEIVPAPSVPPGQFIDIDQPKEEDELAPA